MQAVKVNPYKLWNISETKSNYETTSGKKMGGEGCAFLRYNVSVSIVAVECETSFGEESDSLTYLRVYGVWLDSFSLKRVTWYIIIDWYAFVDEKEPVTIVLIY